MKNLRSRLRGTRDSDSGLSLIEILVAMMVFAIIAVGVAAGLTSSLVMTHEARSREVAANLAAQVIDYQRATPDIFALGDDSKVQTVDGRRYTVSWQTHWETGGVESTTQCSTGSGTLKYKRINVSVRWDGMRSTSRAVTANTLLAPDGRINDPDLGTIVVAVLSANGAGIPGVTVTAAPSGTPNGAVALTTPPKPTDSQGCSYILKVKPGNYDVKISRTNYVDSEQSVDSSTTMAGVTAGSASSAGFVFNDGGRFTPVYDGNVAGSFIIPGNLVVSYVNSYGVFTKPTGLVRLHPFAAGYQAIGGAFVPPSEANAGCLSVDPDAWSTVAADGAIGKRAEARAVAPGAGDDIAVRLGAVTVNGQNGKFVTAVAQSVGPTGSGNPGCALAAVTTPAYPKVTFSKLTSAAQVIQLPFGSWKLYTGSNSGETTTQIATTSMTLKSRGLLTPAGNVLTLDPRLVIAP